MKANTKKAGKPKGNFLSRLKANKELLILSMPGAIWFLFFAYLPLFGILVAFKKFRLSGDGFFYNLFTSETVWFDNFKFLFSSGDAWIIVRNTVLYNLTFIILGVAVPVVLALLLNEIKNKGMMKIYQTLPAGNREFLSKEGKEGVSHAEVAFGVFEVNRVDLMRHCGRTDFAFFELLLEVVQGDVAPDIAVQVDQDRVGTSNGIEEFSHVVMRFDLNRVRIECQVQTVFHDIACESRPVFVRISDRDRKSVV